MMLSACLLASVSFDCQMSLWEKLGENVVMIRRIKGDFRSSYRIEDQIAIMLSIYQLNIIVASVRVQCSRFLCWNARNIVVEDRHHTCFDVQ